MPALYAYFRRSRYLSAASGCSYPWWLSVNVLWEQLIGRGKFRTREMRGGYLFRIRRSLYFASCYVSFILCRVTSHYASLGWLYIPVVGFMRTPHTLHECNVRTRVNESQSSDVKNVWVKPKWPKRVLLSRMEMRENRYCCIRDALKLLGKSLSERS